MASRSRSSSTQSPQMQPLYPNSYSTHARLHHLPPNFIPVSANHLHAHQHQLRLQQHKPRNNLLAALASLMVITIMCTAVVQPRWFSFSSGICSRRYIGLQEFMYLRPLITSGSASSSVSMHNVIPISFSYGQNDNGDSSDHNPNSAARILEAGGALPTARFASIQSVQSNSNAIQSAPLANGTSKTASNVPTAINDQPNPLTGAIVSQPPLPPVPQPWKHAPNLLRMMADHYETQLSACIPAQVLSLQRTIITLCFAVMLLNLIQLMLDSMSIRNRHLDLLRRMAVFNIAGVIICVLIIALSYLISNILADDQLQRQLQRDRYASIDDPRNQSNQEIQRVEINFELSYYLISLAGLVGLVAAALNLFSRPQSPFAYETSRLSEPETGALLSDPHLSSPLWAPLPQLDTSSPLPNAFFNPPPPPYSA